MNYRLIYTGLGLALIAVVAGGIALGQATDRPLELPAAVEAIFPLPGDQVLRQTRVEVDMLPNYEVEIWVDGFRVPDTEVSVIPQVGLYSWTPGPNQVYTEWLRGDHTIRIVWDTTSGLPDPGEYEWTFRIY